MQSQKPVNTKIFSVSSPIEGATDPAARSEQLQLEVLAMLKTMDGESGGLIAATLETGGWAALSQAQIELMLSLLAQVSNGPFSVSGDVQLAQLMTGTDAVVVPLNDSPGKAVPGISTNSSKRAVDNSSNSRAAEADQTEVNNTYVSPGQKILQGLSRGDLPSVNEPTPAASGQGSLPTIAGFQANVLTTPAQGAMLAPDMQGLLNGAGQSSSLSSSASLSGSSRVQVSQMAGMGNLGVGTELANASMLTPYVIQQVTPDGGLNSKIQQLGATTVGTNPALRIGGDGPNIPVADAAIKPLTLANLVAESPPSPAGNVSVKAEYEFLSEGTGDSNTTQIVFVVTRTNPLAPEEIPYQLSGLSAADLVSGNPSDFSGRVSFAPGQLVARVVVNIKRDANIEPTETLQLTLENGIHSKVTEGSGQATTELRNDDFATYAIQAQRMAVLEGNVEDGEGDYTEVKFTVTRTPPQGQEQSVPMLADNLPWSVAGLLPVDLDLHSADYSGTLSFAEGELSKVLTIRVRKDAIREFSNETLRVVLGDSQYGRPDPNPEHSAASTIIIDDDPSIVIYTAPQIEVEGDTLSFRVVRTGATITGEEIGEITIHYQLMAVATGSNSLPVSRTGTAVFPAGVLQSDIHVRSIDDSLVTSDQEFVVYITEAYLTSDPAQKIRVGTATANGTIINNDAEVNISDLSVVPTNTPGLVTYELTLKRELALDFIHTVRWDVIGVGENPASLSDFTLPADRTVVFDAQQETYTVRFTALAGQLSGGLRSFEVRLSETDPKVVLGIDAARANILPDGVDVSIHALSASSVEGNGATAVLQTFEVTLSERPSSTVIIEWNAASFGSIDPMSNASGSDFLTGQYPSGQLTFTPDGSLTQTISITPFIDSLVESSERYKINVSVASGPAFVVIPTAVGTITNDDAQLGFSSLTYAADEGRDTSDSGHGVLNATIVREGFLRGYASVEWSVVLNTDENSAEAANFIDLTQLPRGVAEFTPGMSANMISIDLAGNDLINAAKHFTIVLSQPSPGISLKPGFDSAVATIANDDLVFSMHDAVLETVETNAGTIKQVSITVDRTGDTQNAASVGWTLLLPSGNLNAADLKAGQILTNTLNFAAGQTSQSFVVEVKGDDDLELAEAFTLQLNNARTTAPRGTASIDPDKASTVVTIVNDDNQVGFSTASAALTGKENAPNSNVGASAAFEYTLTREGDLSQPISVNWELVFTGHTASVGDFEAVIGTVTFEAGASTATFNVIPKITDVALEADETFAIRLVTPDVGSGITLSSNNLAQGTIEDDDIGIQILNVSSDGNSEGAQGSVRTYTVTLHRVGNTALESHVNWAIAGEALISGNTNVANALGDAEIFGDRSGEVSWASGDVDDKTFTFQVKGDADVEGDEALRIALTRANNDNSDLQGDGHFVVIKDDDAVLEISSAVASVVEGRAGLDTTLNYTISRTGDLSNTVGVDVYLHRYQTDGITRPTLSSNSAVPIIAGDDAARSDGATRYAHVQFNPSSSTVTITYSDGRPSQTISAVGGTQEANITVKLTGDDVQTLAGESVTLSLDNVTTVAPGGRDTAVLINPTKQSVTTLIVNDDAIFSVSGVATVNEGTSAGSTTAYDIVLTRTGSAGTATTIEWTVAGLGDDPINAADLQSFSYLDASGLVISTVPVSGVLPNGTLTWASDDPVTKSIRLNFKADAVVELDESFKINLSSLTGNAEINDQATFQVIGDDVGVSVYAVQETVIEGNPGDVRKLVFDVVRFGGVASTYTVNWELTGLDASDVLGGVRSGQATIAANSLRERIEITLASDSNWEAVRDKVATLTVKNLAAQELGQASVTVIDDDAKLSISPLQAVAIEGSNAGDFLNFTFTVTRSLNDVVDLSQVSTVDWRVSPESGISVADFISGQNALAQASGLPSGTLSFAENEFSKTITIQIAQDSIKEDDETLTVELFNPSSGTSIASANASGEIRNDDTLIGFVAATTDESDYDLVKAEGDTGTAGTLYTFKLLRSGNTAGEATVNWTLVNITTADGDFIGPRSGAVTFADGMTTGEFTVKVYGDTNATDYPSLYWPNTGTQIQSRLENDEQFKVVLSAPTDSQGIQASGESIATIQNDDVRIQLVRVTTNLPEGAVSDTTPYTQSVTLKRMGDASQAVSVEWFVPTANFSTQIESASSDGINWVPASTSNSGTLTWAIGDVADKTIYFRPVADDVKEIDYTFQVKLRPSAAADAGTAAIDEIGYVQNGNFVYAMPFDSTSWNTTSPAIATLTVKRDESGVWVSNEILETYNSTTSLVTAIGQTYSGGDASNGAGYSSNGINGVNYSSGSLPSNVEGSFAVAQQSTDYSQINQTTLTFADGARSQIVTVNISDDATAEFTEALSIFIAEGTRASVVKDTATVAIEDNDTTPVYALHTYGMKAIEGVDTHAQFKVTLGQALTADATFTLSLAAGTALLNSDYQSQLAYSINGGQDWTIANTVTLSAGQSSFLVRTPLVNDTRDEAVETLSLTVNKTSGTDVFAVPRSSAISFIVDDDSPSIGTVVGANKILDTVLNQNFLVRTIDINNRSSQTPVTEYSGGVYTSASLANNAGAGQDFTVSLKLSGSWELAYISEEMGTTGQDYSEASNSVSLTSTNALHRSAPTFRALESLVNGIEQADGTTLYNIEVKAGTEQIVLRAPLTTAEAALTISNLTSLQGGYAMTANVTHVNPLVVARDVVVSEATGTATVEVIAVGGDFNSGASTVQVSTADGTWVDKVFVFSREFSASGEQTATWHVASLTDAQLVDTPNESYVRGYFGQNRTGSVDASDFVILGDQTASGSTGLPTGTVTFKDGEKEAFVTVRVRADNTGELNEDFAIVLDDVSTGVEKLANPLAPKTYAALTPGYAGFAKIVNDDQVFSVKGMIINEATHSIKDVTANGLAVSSAGTALTSDQAATTATTNTLHRFVITREGDSSAAAMVSWQVQVDAAADSLNRQADTADFATTGTGAITWQSSAVGGVWSTVAQSVTFSAGESTKIVEFALDNDGLAEDSEQFRVVLSNPVGLDGNQSAPVVSPTAGTALFLIGDDDATRVSVSMAASVDEGNNTLSRNVFTITFTRSSALANATQVFYELTGDSNLLTKLKNSSSDGITFNGPATSGAELVTGSDTDHGVWRGIATFAAGATTTTAEFKIAADTYIEPNTNVHVKLYDDEHLPESWGDTRYGYGKTTSDVSVALGNGIGSQAALPDWDNTIRDPNAYQADMVIRDDDVRLWLNFFSNTLAYLDNANTGRRTPANSVETVGVYEGDIVGNGTDVSFTFARAGEQSTDITLNWRIIDRSGTDITDMMSAADNGSVVLLGSSSPAQVTTQTVTINDFFRADTTIEETEGMRIVFTVASNPAIKFTYDYLNESSLVWNGVPNRTSRAGSDTMQVNVYAYNDDVEHTLSHDTGASLTEGAAGTQSEYSFTVTRNGSFGTSTIDWRVVANGAHPVTGDDFATSSAYSLTSGLPQGTLTFDWNQSSKTIALKVKGDNQVEWGEGFGIEIYNPSVGWLGATTSLTGLIVNDDSGIRIGDASARELDGNQTGDYAFTVTRFGDLSQAASVDWLTTDQTTTSSRFVGDVGGTLNFSESVAMTDGYGEQSTTITLHYAGDNSPGADATFGVNLSNLSSNITASNNDIAAVGTVKNDDVVFSIAPTINTQSELIEGSAQTFSYTITRNFSTTQAQTVYWAVSGSGASAANAIDFVGTALPSGSVVFNEGELSKTITVAASNQDGSVEDDETFEVKIINLGGAGSGTENDSWDGVAVNGKILNDDPAIYISTADLRFIEGSGSTNPGNNVVFDVTRKGGTGDQTVTWTIDLGSGQEAAATSDFAAGTLTGTVTFSGANAAEETKTVTVQLNHDTTVELDETFVIRLSNNAFIKPQSLQGVQATIADDDFALLPIASVVTDETDVSTNNILFTVERSGGNAIESLISWRLVFANGAGQANAADFAATSGNSVMLAGSSTATIAVPMRGDTTLESDEAFTLEWQYTLSDGSLSEPLLTTGTLRNDDESFSLAAISPTTEGSGSAGTPVTITVTRDGSTAETSSVQWAVTDNGSSSSNDFFNAQMPTGTVTFAPGEIAKTITVNLSADSEFEPTETFTVTLSNPSANASLGSTVSQIAQILNDDNGYSITSLNTLPVLEGDTGEAILEFKIIRSGGATGVGGGVSWKLSAVNSTDLNSADFLTLDSLNTNSGMPSGSVTFGATEFEKTISVRVKGDAIAEAIAQTNQDSTARITLSSPTGGSILASTADALIRDDDDVLTLTAVDSDQLNAEGDEVGSGITPGYRFVEFNVERTGSLIGQTQVDWAVAGTGPHALSMAEFYEDVAGTLIFDDGDATPKTIQIKVLADTVGEFDEQFVLTLSNPSTGTTVPTTSINYTIRNDDPVLDLSLVSTSVREGQLGFDQLVTFTVTRSGKTVGEALVDWTVSPNGTVATDTNDFGGFYPNGQVLFLDGESTKTVSFLTAGDNIAEFDEGFKIELSNAQHATIRIGSATGIITNDDLQISLTPSVNDVIEGNLGDEQSVGFRLDATGVATAVKALVLWHVEGLTAGALSTSDFRLNQDILQTNNGLPSGETVISLANGTGSQTVNVWLAGDNGVGPDEKFRFIVDSVQALDSSDTLLATGNVLGSGQAVITVKDDDTLIGLRDGVHEVIEGDGGSQTMRFYIDVLDRPDNVVAQDIRVQYSVIGTQGVSVNDFVGGTLPTGELTISANQAIGHNINGAYVDIAVAGDLQTEFNEGFEVRLDRAYVVTDQINNSGVEIASAGARMTGTIIEDDQSLALVTATPIQSEETGRFTFEVLRSGAINNALEATWSLHVAPGTALGNGASSNDFIDPATNQPYSAGTSITGTVAFTSGESVARFTVEVNHDFVNEQNESFRVQLSSTAPSYHETGVTLDLMILNDDMPTDISHAYVDPLLPTSTI